MSTIEITDRYCIGEHELTLKQSSDLARIFDRRRRDLQSPAAPWQAPMRVLEREFASFPHGPWSERRLNRLVKEHVDREIRKVLAKVGKILELRKVKQ